jgi:hypothetical protein
MKILLLILMVVFIADVVRRKPDVVRKVNPTPVPLLTPHVSRLKETRVQPSGKIGERKILHQGSR